MLISEMEAVLKSLDRRVEKLDHRVGRIEQILPTLATKGELRDEVRGVKVLIEDVRGDVKLVHERIDVEMAGLNRQMEARFGQMLEQFAEVFRRLDRIERR
jgi:hypothetical protein